jgi:3-deoxy-D-manno-octulosonate 8-phosphate phosphatase (KDO 8-P phosphatase)
VEGLTELIASTGISADQCAMMGDDVLDLPPMYQCALSLTPSDAHQSVLAYADWVSDFAGGRGAIRQAAEGLILAADAWTAVIEDRYKVTPSDCGWQD